MSKSRKNRQALILASAPADVSVDQEIVSQEIPADAPDQVESPKPVKASRARRPIGLGHPNARKLVNPQHTLELKKSAAVKAGGRMVWANRCWVILFPGHDALVFASRQMAAMSLASFLEAIANPTPTAEVVSEEISQIEEAIAA
ncbi:MAG: hypothetical protein NVS1B10_05890 [Candidatus Saccharimonadales bacterium]